MMLPRSSYLRQLSSCFTQTATALSGKSARSQHLKKKCSVLANHERLCVLMTDKIYVSPKTAYNGGGLQGFDTNYQTVEPVQTLMLASIFSKNKDVAALQPVKNLDTSFLHDSVIKVLKMIDESVGYSHYTDFGQ